MNRLSEELEKKFNIRNSAALSKADADEYKDLVSWNADLCSQYDECINYSNERIIIKGFDLSKSYGAKKFIKKLGNKLFFLLYGKFLMELNAFQGNVVGFMRVNKMVLNKQEREINKLREENKVYQKRLQELEEIVVRLENHER